MLGLGLGLGLWVSSRSGLGLGLGFVSAVAECESAHLPCALAHEQRGVGDGAEEGREQRRDLLHAVGPVTKPSKVCAGQHHRGPSG